MNYYSLRKIIHEKTTSIQHNLLLFVLRFVSFIIHFSISLLSKYLEDISATGYILLQIHYVILLIHTTLVTCPYFILKKEKKKEVITHWHFGDPFSIVHVPPFRQKSFWHSISKKENKLKIV